MATIQERANIVREILFEKYDMLNALWQKAEERITKQHIPQGVSIAYADDYDLSVPDYQRIQPIGFRLLGVQKVKGQWRVCHGFQGIHEEGDPLWTPINDCSIEIRVDAATHWQKLEAATVETAENFVPKVDEAIEALSVSLGAPALAPMKQLLAERARLNGKPKK